MVQKRLENPSLILMDPARVKRALKRMAYQMAEDNKEHNHVLLIGVKDRGYTVAKLLASYLSPLLEHDVAVHQFLDHDNGDVWGDPEDDYSYIVLVDDVIFSGNTMLKALQITLDKMDSRIYRTAVLVDRGHRRVPVEASFRGLELPTKLNEHVAVLTAGDSIKKVVLNKTSF